MKEIEKITSRDNRRLVNARRVRDGKEPEQIFVEGRRLVGEALRSSLEIRECFVDEGFRDRELLDAMAKRMIAIAELPARIFDSIVDTKQPQGIALVAKRPLHSRLTIESRLKTAALPIVIYLKEVNNPSNLGAVLRTAEAADVAGIIISKNSADVFSPKAIRSSMGSSFRLPVLENIDFEEILRWAKEWELTMTASDILGEKSHYQIDWTTPRLLIFGSEAHGLNETELERVAEKIQISMENGVESLNLAVSAGIILFEAKRQNA